MSPLSPVPAAAASISRARLFRLCPAPRNGIRGRSFSRGSFNPASLEGSKRASMNVSDKFELDLVDETDTTVTWRCPYDRKAVGECDNPVSTARELARDVRHTLDDVYYTVNRTSDEWFRKLRNRGELSRLETHVFRIAVPPECVHEYMTRACVSSDVMRIICRRIAPWMQLEWGSRDIRVTIEQCHIDVHCTNLATKNARFVSSLPTGTFSLTCLLSEGSPRSGATDAVECARRCSPCMHVGLQLPDQRCPKMCGSHWHEWCGKDGATCSGTRHTLVGRRTSALVIALVPRARAASEKIRETRVISLSASCGFPREEGTNSRREKRGSHTTRENDLLAKACLQRP